jgi:hypothetical protein
MPRPSLSLLLPLVSVLFACGGSGSSAQSSCVDACEAVIAACCESSGNICSAVRDALGDCDTYCAAEVSKAEEMGCAEPFEKAMSCIADVDDACGGGSHCTAGLEVCQDMFCEDHSDSRACSGRD